MFPGGCLFVIEREFNYRELLGSAHPFSGVSHTGVEISKVIKEDLSSYDIGKFTATEDTVADSLHKAVLDNGSNMVLGLSEFESFSEAVQLYDVECPKKAATAVNNPDGSEYGDHQMYGCDWDVVRESTYVLCQHAAAIDLLQVIKTVTVSSILPIIGGLIYKVDPCRSLKYNGAAVSLVLNTDVQDARKRYSDDLKRRKVAIVSFLEDSDDDDDIVELEVYEATVEEVDCEFTMYLAMPPAKMSEDPVKWPTPNSPGTALTAPDRTSATAVLNSSWDIGIIKRVSRDALGSKDVTFQCNEKDRNVLWTSTVKSLQTAFEQKEAANTALFYLVDATKEVHAMYIYIVNS
ncbi:hypothetical protein CYMTET_5162 [Cymbomonas tetramitiformis]|uniref:Uncharacterized protein n=1 Tax=Cymbomonas tetramitiformis TaxID=36881 RepID=A0AAE0LJM3_9CHLO|nr:hypothetical protein CYMTET_5162 [Cymbomonas tetramitiformis]